MKKWLSGYYPPAIDDFDTWAGDWSMGPHADDDWIWFTDDYYSEEEAKAYIAKNIATKSRKTLEQPQ